MREKMREQMQLPVEQVCETERVSDEGAARLMPSLVEVSVRKQPRAASSCVVACATVRHDLASAHLAVPPVRRQS